MPKTATKTAGKQATNGAVPKVVEVAETDFPTPAREGSQTSIWTEHCKILAAGKTFYVQVEDKKEATSVQSAIRQVMRKHHNLAIRAVYEPSTHRLYVKSNGTPKERKSSK